MAQMVKNLLAMQETQVQSLGWEDPLEKEMDIYPLQHSCLRLAWTEELGGLQCMELQRVRQDAAANAFTFLHLIEFVRSIVIS